MGGSLVCDVSRPGPGGWQGEGCGWAPWVLCSEMPSPLNSSGTPVQSGHPCLRGVWTLWTS